MEKEYWTFYERLQDEKRAVYDPEVRERVRKRKKKKIGEEKALEDELEEELDNELGEPEMTTADVSEDETKDVEKEQNDHLKRKKK